MPIAGTELRVMAEVFSKNEVKIIKKLYPTKTKQNVTAVLAREMTEAHESPYRTILPKKTARSVVPI